MADDADPESDGERDPESVSEPGSDSGGEPDSGFDGEPDPESTGGTGPTWETVPDADEGSGSDGATGGSDSATRDADATADEPDATTGGSDSTDDERGTATDERGAATDEPDAAAGESTAGIAEGDAVLRTSGLTKRFGELVAVDAVDLSVERGEFRSVIGPNGAGKTTLFNLITGALSPSGGTVYFEGEDVTGLPPHRRVRRGLGRSFQITNVFGGLTVWENVRLAAQAVRREDLGLLDRFFRSKDRPRPIAEATDGVLERIGLAGQAEERAGALAYGDRRRLEIGLVLATDPKVVLLDEPTAGMSVDETRETMRLIDDVLADRTLVLIEHDIDLVMDVSDRVTVLHRGSELTTGTPREVADDREVQEAYLGGARP